MPKQGKDPAFAILQMWPEKNFASFFFIHFWFKCYGKCSKKDFFREDGQLLSYQNKKEEEKEEKEEK